MSASVRSLALLAASLPLAACSLVCGFDGVRQPCDAQGGCLPGFGCSAGLCVPGQGTSAGDAGADAGSVPAGCQGDAQCLPAGACVEGFCETVPVAWVDGGWQTPSVGCLPWPGAAAAGNPYVPLHGCLSAPPGGATVAAAGSTVQVVEKGFPLGGPVPVAADARCPSGFGYQAMAPPGQRVDAVVTDGDGAITHDSAIVLDAAAEADGGRRDLVAWSQSGRAAALSALGGGPQSGLVGGVVRDCAGRPLSGVSVALGSDAGVAVAYLDAAGAPLAGRRATAATGLFAVAVPAGEGELGFTIAGADGGSQAVAQLGISVEAAGAIWIDLAPEGP